MGTWSAAFQATAAELEMMTDRAAMAFMGVLAAIGGYFVLCRVLGWGL